MITGESIPVEKHAGDEVIGATLNKTGSFRFRATKVGKDTALANIIRMVQDAQGSKAPIARVVDKVSGYFVPAVMILAVAAFVAWYDLGPEPRIVYATIVLVTTLIIACPCALGLATPTSLTVGIGKGAENGILIRSGDALQTAKQLDAVVLDKTGTITRGEPALTDVVPVAGVDEGEVLRLAASLERGSEHPLGEAIVRGAQERGLALADAADFAAVPGHGVRGKVEGRAVLLGNARLMKDRGVDSAALEADWQRLAEGEDADVPGRRRACGGARRRRRYREARFAGGDRCAQAARARGHHDHRRQRPHGPRHRTPDRDRPRAGGSTPAGQGA